MRVSVAVLLAALLNISISHAGTVTQVAQCDSGTVVYYGTMCVPPSQFGTDGTQILFRAPNDPTFNEAGLDWVPWVLTSPDTVPVNTLSPEQATVSRQIGSSVTGVLAKSKELYQNEGLSGLALMERKAALYRSDIAAVDSVKVGDENTVYIWFKGMNGRSFRDREYPGPAVGPTLDERLCNRINCEIVSNLSKGGMIVVDYGTEVSVPPYRVVAFREELRALRTGKSKEASTIKDQAVLKRFTTPRTPLRAIVEGGR